MVWLGIYSIENAEIWYGWGFILLKTLKYGMAGDVFY